ncbi:MAG TPA: hypothetical protein VK137_07965, partial [Planctomycetaceae bacterium]|nr:hypothetical protein [Planctomycetaceae bacterium]
GRFTLGMLNIQADKEPVSGTPPTNFSVVRLKLDLLRKSSIGVLYSGRSVGQSGGERNDAYGVDGTFAFFDNLTFNTYWARTRTAGLSGEDSSYRAQLDYEGDRYGVQAERLVVGNHFSPEIGFVRRGNMRKNFGLYRFSPRPRSSKRVRKLSWIGSIAQFENGVGRLETRDIEAEFDVEFHSSDKLILRHSDNYEFLRLPFGIAPAVTIPVGGYHFNSTSAGFNFGQQRKLSGNVSAEYGSFYTGRKTAIGFSSGRVNVTPQFSLEPIFSVNWVDLAEGSFTARLVGSRITYTVTPRMFVSALPQYRSSTNTVASNVRLRWEFRPGSELFVVYNEERDTLTPRFPALANRAVILKINRLFRF